MQSESLEQRQHFTQPPPRYTEARLVKTLEEIGIGRPSTYSPTLDTIQRRNYVSLTNKRFIPTELGEIVNEMIEEYFPEILDVKFTANMESELDEVEHGEVEWVKVIDEFYKRFEPNVIKADAEMEKSRLKMNQLALTATFAEPQWYTKWVNMVSFLLAVDFRIVGIQKQSLKKSVLLVQNVRKDM